MPSKRSTSFPWASGCWGALWPPGRWGFGCMASPLVSAHDRSCWRDGVVGGAVAWRTFGESLVTLLVIMDPLGTVPVFLSVTQPMERHARNRAAYVAVLVAAIVLGVFIAFGQALLQYLSISVESLMVAGGVLLFIVALEML